MRSIFERACTGTPGAGGGRAVRSANPPGVPPRSRASSRRIAGERTRPGRRHSARWTSCPKLAAALPSSWQRERSAISSLPRRSGRSRRSARPGVSHVRREGMVEPAAIRFVADQVEALIELAAGTRRWSCSNGTRGTRAARTCVGARQLHALPRSARGAGAVDEAMAHYEEALTFPSAGRASARPRSLSRPRSGPTTREAPPRRVRSRRHSLSSSESARRWAERARAELKRISGRCTAGSAHALRGAGRRPCRRGEDEPRGRRGALPLRADGRRSSLAR